MRRIAISLVKPWFPTAAASAWTRRRESRGMRDQGTDRPISLGLQHLLMMAQRATITVGSADAEKPHRPRTATKGIHLESSQDGDYEPKAYL